ncbi:DUF3043 domain-containing protein [Nostocoides veronense]|uniref:DUF3043 domain-containing protein n=1 Tax=Nostocoides veronense TaxID=330836 RepID=A0ABP4XKN7_9MICO
MFGRKDKAVEAPQDAVAHETRPGAKNRPTPKRRDQEAARKQPMIVTDRKAAKQAERAKRMQASGKMRQAMVTGDDRYLPARDKGPVRRFVRDSIDARWNLAEFLLPFMVMTLALQFVRASWAPFVFIGVYVLILIALLDGFLAWRRIKARLRDRFPNENLRGLGGYAAMRMMQMRRLRMPKPQVARGENPA